MDNLFGKNNDPSDDESQWISVSDLMAGLMIVFLFISIVLMRSALLERDKVKVERDKIKEVAAAYQRNKADIYKALMAEFQSDLKKWDAEIDPHQLTFQFNSPDVLFAVGSTDISREFQDVLSDFFPRYMTITKPYRGSIDEVRIEGHTSSRWNQETSTMAYFNNMELSQGRTRSVLTYLYNLRDVYSDRNWIKTHIAAVGYSSAKLIKERGIENATRSRRVNFRIVTNAEMQILKIIEQ